MPDNRTLQVFSIIVILLISLTKYEKVCPFIEVGISYNNKFFIGLSLIESKTFPRIKSDKSGLGFEIGARAFAGAEFFIAPKLSIAGEFGWGIGYMSGGKTTTTIEATGNTGSGNTKDNISQTVKNGGHFVIDTDLNNTSTGSLLAPSGSLRLNLHF